MQTMVPVIQEVYAVVVVLTLSFHVSHGFALAELKYRTRRQRASSLRDMKRPLLDQIASALFRLETDRVAASSEVDDKGRNGEPMEWSESKSTANIFSQIVAGNPMGAWFKQAVADLVAGEYDPLEIQREMDDFINSHEIAMFSFTTCPFCRRAKDALDQGGYLYSVLELDEQDNGNAIRAMLGKRTGRTSVPSIFVNGNAIGGCNDGPGLLPLMASGEFDKLISP